ncbi:phosphoenolpyruvate carboxykinase (ATP) [soil metagenome]
MQHVGIQNEKSGLEAVGLKNIKTAYWNLSPAELTQHSLDQNEGVLADSGALVIDTGKFTGRSPKDKYCVKDSTTENSVNWGEVNIPVNTETFDKLQAKIADYLEGKNIYVRDGYVCAHPQYRMNLRVISEKPWQSLFAYNMFLRPEGEELKSIAPEWTVLCASGFKATPVEDGVKAENFAIVNFTKKMIIIGGTGYTGEIKKGIFTVLNYVLPHDKNVLSMHCSANIGKDGDTAIFFGLSGTGKTTLSADPNRGLIGDDEHGWSEDSVFNFEGGCYAKAIDPPAEKEPQIFAAIRPGALVENTTFYPGTKEINFADGSRTENTRVSYPLTFIDNAVEPSYGPLPKNIFFLTADAFGVLPPISRLTPGQAMFHFISGYTAKVAGTEAGINEPKTTFSACFGAVFLPLHPTKYAEMLGEKMRKNEVKVWLINTGWTGGPYGIGSRMKLSYTRAMITAALNGELDNVEFEKHRVFGLAMPRTCPNVPSEILSPRNSWADKDTYDQKANELAEAFNQNFAKYADKANDEILAGAPKPVVNS